MTRRCSVILSPFSTQSASIRVKFVSALVERSSARGGPIPKGRKWQIAAQNQGIFEFIPGSGVISFAAADFYETETFIKLARRHVAHADLQEHAARSQPVGMASAGAYQTCALACAAVLYADRKRQYFRLIAGCTHDDESAFDLERECARSLEQIGQSS